MSGDLILILLTSLTFFIVVVVLVVIIPTEHLIDLDADPFVPDGWKVEEHHKGVQLIWDASEVKLYLSKKQGHHGDMEGHQLYDELEGQHVFNANLLDYLLKNPHLIPKEWKKKTGGYITSIFFWGTIYRQSNGALCVRYLQWTDIERKSKWRCGYALLSRGWSDLSPAAVRS